MLTPNLLITFFKKIFPGQKDLLYLLYNQLKQMTMKNQILLNVMTVWTAGLMIMAVAGIGYAIVSLLLGNYTSTAAFEF